MSLLRTGSSRRFRGAGAFPVTGPNTRVRVASFTLRPVGARIGRPLYSRGRPLVPLLWIRHLLLARPPSLPSRPHRGHRSATDREEATSEGATAPAGSHPSSASVLPSVLRPQSILASLLAGVLAMRACAPLSTRRSIERAKPSGLGLAQNQLARTLRPGSGWVRIFLAPQIQTPPHLSPDCAPDRARAERGMLFSPLSRGYSK